MYLLLDETGRVSFDRVDAWVAVLGLVSFVWNFCKRYRETCKIKIVNMKCKLSVFVVKMLFNNAMVLLFYLTVVWFLLCILSAVEVSFKFSFLTVRSGSARDGSLHTE